jgi:maleylacetoacetate isomerase
MSANTEALSRDLILYTYFRSSAAFRVRIALNLKDLKPEQRFVHLLKHDQWSDEYRALNPQGTVPLLLHNGRPIGQSLAIIEYLEEIAPQPSLLPSNPLERARARQIACAIACEIHPLGNLRVREYLAGTMDRTENELAEWTRHWIGLGLAAVERLAGDGRFCVNDTPSIADICLIPQLFNARRAGLDLTPFPRLLRIEKAAYELAAVADAQPKNQPDAE